MALWCRAGHATKENAMTKAEYLSRLESLLSCLPEGQRAESLAFYEEMILDRMEEGLSEEEAISTLDAPGVVAEAILDDLPAVPRVVAKTRRKSRVLLWVLVILGFPVWGALLAALAITVLSFYATVWIFVAVVWGLAVLLVLGCPLFLLFAICGLIVGNAPYTLVEFGAALVALGLGLLLVRLAFELTRGVALLSAAVVRRAVSPFVKRRDSDAGRGGHGGSHHDGGAEARGGDHRPIPPEEFTRPIEAVARG